MDIPDWWPHPKPYAIMDCLEGMKALPDKCVDLVLTDPPYAQSLEYGRGQLGTRKIKGDFDTSWIKPFMEKAYRILKNNTHFGMFCQWRSYSIFEKEMLNSGFKIRTVCVWNKMNAGLSGGGYAEQYENIIIAKKGEARQNKFSGNVYEFNRLNGRPEHPNEKPEEIIIALLEQISHPGDIVLDPFLGSGTTLRACRETNRIGLGFEIEKDYEPIIQKRMMEDIPALERWF